jgi:inner membrane protein
MDNVTHALAGMLLADVTLIAVTPRGEALDPRFRRRARWASAIANNLPDLDFMLRRVTPGRIGYLLHHRGHSHTLGVGLLLGALAFFALRALWRTPTAAPRARERRTLLGLCLFGPCAHVAMDFSNNYGVHPFWPLYDGWLYGDAVFIIEPLFWVLTIPALALASKRRATRLFLFGILAIGVALAWVTAFANGGTALFLTLAAAAFTALNFRLTQRARTIVACAGSLATALLFFVASAFARSAVVSAARNAPRGAPRVELADVSLAPAPSNPFCWSAMAVGRQGDRYALLVATVTLAPGVVPARACALEPTGRTLALRVPDLADTPSVRWDGEWTAPLGDLGLLSRENCEAAAYLRWARLPFWVERPAHELVLGDLRYDRSPELEFAETVGTSPPTTCPKRVPPWIPPRADLIEPRSSP